VERRRGACEDFVDAEKRRRRSDERRSLAIEIEGSDP
jgi:hypothetical protein